jgi:hypothetical protein
MAEEIQLSGSEELSVYIEEYKSQRTEILQRIEIQQKILSYSLILTGIIIGFGGSLINRDDGTSASIGPWGLLLSALVFTFFSLSSSSEDTMIVWSAKYINRVLRPRIEAILRAKALGWEDFLAEERERRPMLKTRLLFLPCLGQEYPLIAVVFLLFTSWFFYDWKSCWLGLLFVIDIVFCLAAIYIRILVAWAYRGISDSRKPIRGS